MTDASSVHCQAQQQAGTLVAELPALLERLSACTHRDLQEPHWQRVRVRAAVSVTDALTRLPLQFLSGFVRRARALPANGVSLGRTSRMLVYAPHGADEYAVTRGAGCMSGSRPAGNKLEVQQAARAAKARAAS